MKKLLIFVTIILLYSGATNAYDIVYPGQEIKRNKAWAHGLSVATKTVGSDTYFALEIEERLLCEVGEVGFIMSDPVARSPANQVKYIEGSYVASAKLDKHSEAFFSIKCNNPSKYNGLSRFYIGVWP